MKTEPIDFRFDGWTVEQYAYCMRELWKERKRAGVEEPRVTYYEALEWHRKHKRGVVVIPAEEIREAAAA